MVRRTLGLTIAGAAAAVVLGSGSTLALHAMASGSTGIVPAANPDGGASCTVPSLPGSVTQIALSDMGGTMGRSVGSGFGGMGVAGRTSGMGGVAARGGMGGAMSISVSPGTVHAGTVSLEVANRGSIVHELVVLPLSGQARVGQRTVGSDDRVSETGSKGEASTSCGAGAGDGIAAGAVGWVTLDLAPGRYELVCNIAGHYAAGMYAELDVTA